MNFRLLLSTALFGLMSGCGSLPPLAEPAASTTQAAQQAVPTEALNADVRQETIQQTIWVPGYTASVRPSTTYTNGVNLKLLREQELLALAAKDFELDHRVPLALGGHPRSLQNLTLQPWEGTDGAKVKDRLERRLQRLVCSGRIFLDDARGAIYFNWQGAYRAYVGMVSR